MEFDRAVERKVAGSLREILIFTAHQAHPCTFADVEADGDAQKKLNAFKAKATDGRVRKEFRSVEELRTLVSDALHEYLRRERASQPAASTVSTPQTSIVHNLPSLQPFFGREDELRKIARAAFGKCPANPRLQRAAAASRTERREPRRADNRCGGR